MPPKDQIELLRRRLNRTLPGVDAQLRLAPTYRMNADMARIDGKPCRDAGVLVLLYPEEQNLNLILTVRPDHMTVHAGQISFPGGRVERGETHLDAALREAEEEIGLDRRAVDVLGELTPLYIPPSNFCVHPFVGFCADLPPLRPTDDEVHAILHVTLPELFNGKSLRREVWNLRGEQVEVPFFRYTSYKIWGATAMMLSELQVVMEGEEAGKRPEM